MNTAELHTLLASAARAAGIDFHVKVKRNGSTFPGQIKEGRWEWWNPLNDSRDCFELECLLGLSVTVDLKRGEVTAYHQARDCTHRALATNHCFSISRARRHAVIMLAAELGDLL